MVSTTTVSDIDHDWEAISHKLLFVEHGCAAEHVACACGALLCLQFFKHGWRQSIAPVHA